MVSGAGLTPGHQRPVGLPAPPHLSKEREQRQIWQIECEVNVGLCLQFRACPVSSSVVTRKYPRCVGEKTREKNAFSELRRGALETFGVRE